MPAKRRKCFVIMPFSKTTEEHTEEYWTNHFEYFLKPLIEECPEVEPHRSEPLRGDVLRQIITQLVVCPIVVADITDRNPNVFWELGVRQSFRHRTVTIAEEGTKIPFDVSVKSTLFYYPKDHVRNAKFAKKFKKAIVDCLSHPDSPDSHVLETVSGRGTLYEIFCRDEAIRRLEALLSESDTNARVFDKIYETMEKNQQNPKRRKFDTIRFRSAAVEFLVINRYVDEKKSFYDLAEGYFTKILVRNGQLAVWEQTPDTTENWFLSPKTRKNFEDLSSEFRNELKRIKERLVTSF